MILNNKLGTDAVKHFQHNLMQDLHTSRFQLSEEETPSEGRAIPR